MSGEAHFGAEVVDGEIFPDRKTFETIITNADSTTPILMYGTGSQLSGEFAMCLPFVINPGFREGYLPSDDPIEPLEIIKSAVSRIGASIDQLAQTDERIPATLLNVYNESHLAGQKAAEAIK